MQMILPICDPKKICSMVGCFGLHQAKGYCSKHYERFRKNGYPWLIMGKIPRQFKICLVYNCSLVVASNSYCNRHYLQNVRTGNPLTELKRKPLNVLTCIAEGCELKARGMDFCSKHLSRYMRHGSANPVGLKPRSSPIPFGTICSFDGCQLEMRSMGLCNKHYQRHIRFQNPEKYANYVRRRRFRKATGFVSQYSLQELQLKMHYWGYKCWMCGGSFDCVDHVKPLKHGGKDCLSNLRPACKPCNSKKSAKWFGVTELHKFIKS